MDARLILRVFIIVFCIDVSIGRPVNVEMTLTEQCMHETPQLRGKVLNELLPMEIGALLGCVDQKHIQFKSMALKAMVATYSCWKFEMYEDFWNYGGSPGADFVHDYIPENLPDNSKLNYKSHHKIWQTILTNPGHPGANRFVAYLTERFGVLKGKKKVLNVEQISRRIAFAVVMLQNSKHGDAAKEIGMDFFKSAQEVRKALDQVQCIEDPVILDVVEMFEEVTRGKEKKPEDS